MSRNKVHCANVSRPQRPPWSVKTWLLLTIASIVALAMLLALVFQASNLPSPQGLTLGLHSTSLLTPTEIAPSQRQSQILASFSKGLIAIITEQQTKYVRASWGEADSQRFTDLDLDVFHKHNILGTIKSELGDDQQFRAIILLARSIDKGQLQETQALAASHFKPTWTQNGRVDRSGQTEVGQQAEREIAEAIVSLLVSNL